MNKLITTKKILIDQKKFDRMSKKMLKLIQGQNPQATIYQCKDMLAQSLGFENEFQIQNQIFNAEKNVSTTEIVEKLHQPWKRVLSLIEHNLIIIQNLNKELSVYIDRFLEEYRIFNMYKCDFEHSTEFRKDIPGVGYFYLPEKLFSSLKDIFKSTQYNEEVNNKNPLIHKLYFTTLEINMYVELLKELYTEENTFICNFKDYKKFDVVIRKILKKIEDRSCRDFIKVFFSNDEFDPKYEIERLHVGNNFYDFYFFDDFIPMFPDGCDFTSHEIEHSLRYRDVKQEKEIIVLNVKGAFIQLEKLKEDKNFKKYEEKVKFNTSFLNKYPNIYEYIYVFDTKDKQEAEVLRKYLIKNYDFPVNINIYKKAEMTKVDVVVYSYDYYDTQNVMFYKV